MVKSSELFNPQKGLQNLNSKSFSSTDCLFKLDAQTI